MDKNGTTSYHLISSGQEQGRQFIVPFSDVGTRVRPSGLGYLEHLVKVKIDDKGIKEALNVTELNIYLVFMQLAPLFALVSSFTSGLAGLILNVNYIPSSVSNPRTSNMISLDHFDLRQMGGRGLAKFLCIVTALLEPISVVYSDMFGRNFTHTGVLGATTLHVKDAGVMPAFLAAGAFVLPRTAMVVQVVREFLGTLISRIEAAVVITKEEIDVLIGHALSTVYEVHTVLPDGSADFRNFIGVGRPDGSALPNVLTFLSMMMRDVTPVTIARSIYSVDTAFSFSIAMDSATLAGLAYNYDKLHAPNRGAAGGISSLNEAAVVRHVSTHDGYLLRRGNTVFHIFPRPDFKGYEIDVNGQFINIRLRTKSLNERVRMLNFFCHFLLAPFAINIGNGIGTIGWYDVRPNVILSPHNALGAPIHRPSFNPAYYVGLMQRTGANISVEFQKINFDRSQGTPRGEVMEAGSEDNYIKFRTVFANAVSNAYNQKTVSTAEVGEVDDFFRKGISGKEYGPKFHSNGDSQ